MAYELAEWKGKVCSTCALFNTSEVAFVPFELCLPSDLIQLCDFEMAQAYFAELGEEAACGFRSMAVFDSLIANTDRHSGNFGVLRDNRTGSVLGMAPLFDHNVSLFSLDFDEHLAVPELLCRLEESSGIMDATLAWQGSAMLGDTQRECVERLVEFSFDGTGFIEEYRVAHPEGKVISERRLDVLSDFVRIRARRLLG